MFDFSIGDGDAAVCNVESDCLKNVRTIGVSESEIETVVDDVTDGEEDKEEDTLGDKLTDVVFEAVGDPVGVKLGDVEGVGDTELKLINMLNVYLHTGLSDTNVIVVVAPY